ncbi:LOW QUALITY PROTEIN: myozenin-3-like [Perognathus longimembris pacificus]|uniref:LOW QUALITY PROTEIN: myozenin-3-like n=1 Tax=Perognathus longimembris pacificus TaxID=214514 RepID=UPI0020191594|nr:LOW QUALITY PROTEIN: myozenin-3-like [Perognathus longimembris pacificus]
MISKEQKQPTTAVMGSLAGPVPSLDLGKKLSVPQDLMLEELSLRNNRGSLLFQKRHRRVQRFIEFEASQPGTEARSPRGEVTGAAAPGTVASGPQGQHLRASPRGLEDAGAAAAAAQPERARSPSALAPGYAEPLQAVPPEKFNHTSIPKGYRCPWQELARPRELRGDLTPRVPDLRNFNRTPVPFGGALDGETFHREGTPFVPEPFSGLELLRLRPNFNRVAQGWVRKLPESEEL